MKFKQIKKKDIEPSGWNPRSSYDETKLAELKQSIQGVGLVEPIIVRPKPKKAGKYILTAGEGRYNSFDDNDRIDCIVREESEIDAKVTSLIENYVRAKVSDKDHEKFINDVYQIGIKMEKWMNSRGMHSVTGIKETELAKIIRAYEDRKALKPEVFDQGKISTTDLEESRPLKDRPIIRKKFLEKRAKGEIKGSGHIVFDQATTLAKVPKPVAKAVVEDRIKIEDVQARLDGAGEIPEKVAEELVKKLEDEDLVIKVEKEQSAKLDVISITEKKGATPEALDVKKSIDEKRLEQFEQLRDKFRFMTIHHVNQIKTPKQRDEAIGCLKQIRDKCSELLVQLKVEDVIEVKK